MSNIKDKTVKEKVKSPDHYRKIILSNIKHDLTNPINAILGYSELIMDIVEEEDNMNNQETTTTTTIPSVWGCSHGPCAIDDIYHPSVQGHKFYAMSVYYYALDCVRQLGPEPLPHW